MAKRKKVDWFAEIKELNLIDDFEKFVEENNFKQHLKGKQELSRNRLACAYVRHVSNVIRKVKWC